MRILLALFISLAFTITLFSQENDCGYLIPGGSKSWHLARYEFAFDEVGELPIGFEQRNDHYLLCGDTVIDGFFSQIMYYIEHTDNISDTIPIGYYSCEGDYVTYYPYWVENLSFRKQPVTMFDSSRVLNFQAEVGDTILRTGNDIGGDVFIVVNAIDTVSYQDGILRKRYDIKDVQYFGGQAVSELPSPFYLVEGVGNIRSGIHLHFLAFGDFDWNTRRLICYHENGEIVYKSEDFTGLECSIQDVFQTDTSYVSLLSDGIDKRWNLLEFTFDFDTSTQILYNFHDTIVEGQEFQKFYLTNEEYEDNQQWYSSGNFVGAIREEGRKIYFSDYNNYNHPLDIPLIDFSADISDTIFRYVDSDSTYWFGLAKQKIDRILDDGTTRTRFSIDIYSFDLNDNEANVEWRFVDQLFEGALLLHPQSNVNSIYMLIFDLDWNRHVQCYFEDNQMVYHSNYWATAHLPCFNTGVMVSTDEYSAVAQLKATAFPNPTQGLIQLRTDPSYQLLSVELISSATGRRKFLPVSEGITGLNSLNLAEHPVGHYILLLRFKSGEVKRISLVKN